MIEKKRYKVLLSAYACEPNKGSEPGVGWNWVEQIARFHEVWVITRTNNRESIERGLKSSALPNVHWIYFDLPYWVRFWKKGHRGVHFYYYLWQIGIYFLAKKLHRRVNFDLIHHVTFVIYWMPCFLSLLPAPLIWGPVGGGESAPKRFWSEFSTYGKTYEILRNFVRYLGELNPFVYLSARRAAFAMATTEETAERLRALGCHFIEVYSQVGLSEEEIQQLSSIPYWHNKIFRLMSIGRLLHLKGFSLSIKAFAKLQQYYPESEYWFIGDGSERKRLSKLSKELGIADKVKFHGKLPREEVFKIISECDALIHPSLHDSGGWVCLEAMTAGRPVICLDLGGPALQVTKKTGFNVQPITPKQVIGDMAESMLLLAQDQTLYRQMGEAGRKRVKNHFSWEKKGNWMVNIYQDVVKRYENAKD